jgi:hypothetical protein
MRTKRSDASTTGWFSTLASSAVVFAVLFLANCGGGSSSTPSSPPPPPPPPPPPTLQSISIVAPGSSLTVGDVIQLGAIAVYSDGSSKDVSSSTTWSLPQNSVATITTAGVLNALAVGSVTVHAASGSLNATLPILVTVRPTMPGLNGFSWKSVNTQGMGYVTGMVIHPLAPNDIYIRTDVGGAYRFDRTNQYWVPLLDHYGRLESEIYGVESIAVDPTDTNTVYIAAAHGRTIAGGNVFTPAEVLVSHDRGATWADTGLAAQVLYIGANDAYRGTTGERLAVDPNQPSVMYFASRQNGLWRGVTTSTPAKSWTQVAGGMPSTVATPGVTFVVFDPSAGVAGAGGTKNIYAGVYGSGVYASTDGGVTWAPIAGGSNPVRAAVASDGTLFVTFGGDEGGTTGSVGRYKAAQWTDVTPQHNGKSYAGISVDPTNPQVVVAAVNGGIQIFRSTDQGNTWSAVTVGGFSYQPQYYPSGAGTWGNAALVIDPAQPKRVWQTNGYGVIETDDITVASTTWSWQMTGLEELVVQKIKAPPVVTVPGTNQPGADLISAVADMVGFRHTSRDIVPTATTDHFLYVAQATGITYCASQPQNAAFVGWDETNGSAAMSGITADNGLTWKHIPNTAPGSGGKIAMASDNPLNMVWAPPNATPQYTEDGGNTWHNATYNGAPLSASWQLSNQWWTADVLAPDLVAAQTFYYFDNGNFYYSSDGGVTWTLRNTTWPVDPHWVLNVSIIPNPTKAGDVWMAFAPNSNQTWTYPLLHSTDGGQTFTVVNSVASANFVAFGKGLTATTPAIYIHGQLPTATEDAIYQSLDMGSTWVQISDPTLMQFGEINSLEGDMRTQDLIYVANSGRGIFYGYGPNSGVTRYRRHTTKIQH